MTKTPLRVLCIEDTSQDAELLEAHLSLKEFDVTLKRVETTEEMRQCLDECDWDIVLADYSLPRFSAAKALDILKESGKDIPFIVVSGTIGETRAIEMMRAGANDFIVKGDFIRLIPAIRRELNESTNRKARREAETALALSEQSFKRLADAMPQLVWTASPDGRINYANQRCYIYTGLQDEQMLGWAWTSVVAPEEALKKYEKGIAAGEEFSFEHQLRAANGEYRWFLTRATPSCDSQGKISIWYAASTDIHEQKSVSEELRIAKVMAEEASEAKSAFLANMSHEIRTPLGAILGFAELLEDPGQTEAERQECIATIRRNGQLLSKVINEILDLSKIESQKLEIENEPFEVMELLEDVHSLLDLTAREKGLRLQFSIDPTLPRIVVSDFIRLKQILINIAGNAVKFTESGKVTIKARLGKLDLEDSKAQLEFEVTDTGVGIPKEHVSKLFQPFVQVDSSMTRKFGGTGLGLSLSRKLAQALGGNVVLAHSAPGQGSTFICSVQVQLQEAEKKELLNRTNVPIRIETPLDGRNVLVVEDLPENRLLIEKYLSRAGAKVDLAEDGLQGVRKALEGNYDVMILDLHMPVMDGYEAIKRLRSQGYQKPVIALTAFAMRGDRERCLNAGFTEHLSKPIDRTRLVELIKSL